MFKRILRVPSVFWSVLRDWSRDKPFQFIVIVVITLFSALVIIFLPVIANFVTENVELEPVPIPDMIIESTVSTPTPTPLYEIDVAFVASIELTNCELNSGCEIPIWESHERNVLVGTIPENDVVDVSSCFYPLVRQEQLEPDSSGRPIISTFNAYTIEGLWCEVYYLSTDGDIVKGMTQYWNLSVISYEQEVIVTEEPEIDVTDEAEIEEESDEAG